MDSQIFLLLLIAPFVCCSNYDNYIGELQQRNQVLHSRVMNNPVVRDSLTELYNRYPGRDVIYPETNDEEGEISPELWDELLTQLKQVRSRSNQGRAPEHLSMQNHLWGEHRVSGGSGEGNQLLDSESGPVSPKTEVKTDRLPAYCNPPNPCPLGLDESELPGPCDNNVDDTKDFNRNWIWSKMLNGECTCDSEHMKPCPKSSARQRQRANFYHSANANPYLSGNKRAQLVGKKAPTMWGDSKKNHQTNPYLDDDVLPSVIKKAGPPKPEWM